MEEGNISLYIATRIHRQTTAVIVAFAPFPRHSVFSNSTLLRVVVKSSLEERLNIVLW